jgi:XRE family transcriptional regulator, regulator of sulfur utilization
MNLGRTIQELRKSKDLRQEDLAERCGITVSYLSQIENNRKEPLLGTVREIANKLEIPLPILFFLAMDDADIPDEKRSTYGVMNTFMRGLLLQELEGNQKSV